MAQRPFVASFAATVTASDSTIIPFSALYIGVTGDVAITTLAGQTVTFKAVPVGILPVSGNKVMSTNTTATNIVALS